MVTGSGRCHYHPQRAGIGICVECRHVICTECTTQFEGINRCAQCLGKRLKAATRLAARNDWSAGNVITAVLAIALLLGAVELALKAVR